MASRAVRPSAGQAADAEHACSGLCARPVAASRGEHHIAAESEPVIPVEELARDHVVALLAFVHVHLRPLGAGSEQAPLEQTDLPVEAVARKNGLSSATNLRRRFRGTLHTSPAAYRRSFGGHDDAQGHGTGTAR